MREEKRREEKRRKEREERKKEREKRQLLPHLSKIWHIHTPPSDPSIPHLCPVACPSKPWRRGVKPGMTRMMVKGIMNMPLSLP